VLSAAQPTSSNHHAFDLNNPQQRQAFAENLRQRRRPGIERAAEYLRRTGKPKRWKNGQSICELMSIDEDGQFIVYTTCNANSAISIAADIVRDDPYYGFTGNGVTVGVWDAGIARPTHQELIGRVISKDTAAATYWHTTMVSGVLAATGINTLAKGMAPLAQIWGYEWNNDTTEMAIAARSSAEQTDKIQLSNHSYGITSGWLYNSNNSHWEWYGDTSISNTESYFFGLYHAYVRDIDEVCYDAPYYLPFQAAGNDRGDGRPSAGTTYYINGATETTFDGTNPKADNWDNGGFDTLMPEACAKNVLTIGGVNDAVTGGLRDPNNAAMTSFSSWGPTDDGRVKPDLVTNGTSIFSCYSTNDTSYATLSATSYAAPAAAGVAAQLVELYGRLFPGQYMRSSTLKALMIHTADDLGNPGPDYKFGWGLINAEAAVEKILLHKRNPNLTAKNIFEDSLTQSRKANEKNLNDEFTFEWDGISPIKATLCWTDPAGTASSTLDSTVKRLEHNLELKIIAPNWTMTYNPFILNPSAPSNLATTGVNDTDNIEQVLIPPSQAEQGIYRISITFNHEEISWPTPNIIQHYSVILSGQAQPAVYDIDRDGTIGLGDLSAMANSWMTNTAASDIYPAVGDGSVDMLDFALLSQFWVEP